MIYRDDYNAEKPSERKGFTWYTDRDNVAAFAMISWATSKVDSETRATNERVLRIVQDRLKEQNQAKPCRYTSSAIDAIEEALGCLELRSDQLVPGFNTRAKRREAANDRSTR